MTKKLQGRVALVTGGARGIGAASALALSEAGAAVLITDVLNEEGQQTAARIVENGGGSIINLSSVAGIAGAAFAVPYNASKGAVRLMTKGAALECSALGYKIRVNSIHPGVIDTIMGQGVMDGSVAVGGGSANEVRANVIALHPLGRLGVAADMANAVVFLASDDSAFMTGSEVVVDGGMTRPVMPVQERD